jgi:hypothetical protein
MASLFWNVDRRELTPGLGHIGALKSVIENTLRNIGFSDVRQSQLDVGGKKNGVLVSIPHFQISGPIFWEVVIASGDFEDMTRDTRDEVVAKLRSLVFFD